MDRVTDETIAVFFTIIVDERVKYKRNRVTCEKSPLTQPLPPGERKFPVG
jgi:hypothetical protein